MALDPQPRRPPKGSFAVTPRALPAAARASHSDTPKKISSEGSWTSLWGSRISGWVPLL